MKQLSSTISTKPFLLQYFSDLISIRYSRSYEIFNPDIFFLELRTRMYNYFPRGGVIQINIKNSFKAVRHETL